MYQIKCDDYILLDHRDPKLIVSNPKAKVAVNTVGEASFTIHKTHPFYDKLKYMKSIFEISDEIGVVFRGRMTSDTGDFYNSKAVDLEGLMAFFNDSVVKPFNFPEDFLDNSDYITAAESGNVVEFFLNWLIENHNSQVQDFQKFKLGTVTVSDPNNYITRSESKYANTWELLKSKLFESTLGGKLCIRYENDGNYIDYLSEFTLVNTQEITYGKNLLDLSDENDASTTYSAIVATGAEIETEVEGTDENGEATTTTVKTTVTLDSIEDGDITDDIVKATLKNGIAVLYSKSAVKEYGWIVAPTEETTWDDVTEVENLLTKSVDYLANKGVMMSNTVEYKAADLHFSDAEIRSLRIYRKVKVNSPPHNKNGLYDLTELDLDLLNPQNTNIVVGETVLTLTEKNSQLQSEAIERIEKAEKDISENRSSVSEVQNQTITQITQVINDCEEIVLKAITDFEETGSHHELREYVEAQLKVLSNGITGSVTELTEKINNVDGDLQAKYNTITKYFTFDINGLMIGSTDENGNPSPYKVVIDNDRYSMVVNDTEVLWIDAISREVHTPELTVTDRFKLFGYEITEDEESGRVDCFYVGG